MELFTNHRATDANNWMVIASKAMAEGLVVGFVDGIEEPQIFVADAENIGAMFNKDAIQFKYRHIYAAACVDHRPFAGGIVA
jgi:hypothetical protein